MVFNQIYTHTFIYIYLFIYSYIYIRIFYVVTDQLNEIKDFEYIEFGKLFVCLFDPEVTQT